MRIVNRIVRQALVEFESLVRVPHVREGDLERFRAVIFSSIRRELSKGRGRWPNSRVTKTTGNITEYRVLILKDVYMTWDVEETQNWFGRRTRTVTILGFTGPTSVDRAGPGR